MQPAKPPSQHARHGREGQPRTLATYRELAPLGTNRLWLAAGAASVLGVPVPLAYSVEIVLGQRTWSYTLKRHTYLKICKEITRGLTGARTDLACVQGYFSKGFGQF